VRWLSKINIRVGALNASPLFALPVRIVPSRYPARHDCAGLTFPPHSLSASELGLGTQLA